MTRAFVKTLLLACVTLLLAGVVFGQAAQTTGRIEGTAKDQTGGVIPGVTVTISSATGTKSMITGDSGEFAFPFLTPGNYDIKAELEGFKTYEQKGVTIRLGLTSTINLVLSPGEISEVVTVTGEAPLVDTTTTTIGSNITDAMYTSMPVRRNFSNLFNFAPGVSDGGQVGSSNPSIGGASGLENNYVIDGVNVTNTGYGSLGSYSNVYGSMGTGVNFDFVKEVQIKSGGFEAEYGQSTGGVVNVITKSGGNEFHGGVYFYLQPAGWQASRNQPNTYRYENLQSMTLSQQNYDVSFDLSGYLWKDKLFFYAAFNPQWNTSSFRAPAGIGQDIDGISPYEQESHYYSWSAKASYVPHPNHTFEFSTFADPSNRGTGPNRSMLSTGDTSYSKLHFGSWNLVARYNGVLSNNWFLTGSYSRAYNRFEEAMLYDSLVQYRDYVSWFYDNFPEGTPVRNPTGYDLRGGVGFFENNNGTNNQFNIKTTFTFTAAGEHTMDFGYAYEDVGYVAFRRYTGPMVDVPAFGGFEGAASYGALLRHRWYRQADGTYWDRNGDGTLDGSDAVWWQTRGNYNDPNISTETKYHSFYAQDAWKISANVTLKAGVRYDYQKIAGGGEGSSDFVFDGNWAPRFGLIYDVKGDGKTKVYGSWGRFFQKIPQDLAVRALSVETGFTSVYWGDLNATDFLNDDMVAAGLTVYPGYGSPYTIGLTGSVPTIVYPGTKAMFQDEFVLGFDHELSPTMSIGARYIWRHVGRGLEDCGSQTPGQWNGTEPSAEEYQYVIANVTASQDIFDNALGVLGSDGIPDGFADMTRTYNAFEVTLEKRFSQGFQFLANYRLAKVWGNWEGLFRNDNGQDDPFITSLFDFRDEVLANGGRALGVSYVPGYLNTDRRHVLNFNGAYTLPCKLTFGIGARLTSGYPLTPVGTHPASGYGDNEIPGILPDGTQVVRGYAGRSDWINDVDLHADYPFTFGDNYRLRFAVDLFNVFNLQKTTQVDTQSQSGGDPYADYLTPTTFQRSFNMRASIRFEF